MDETIREGVLFEAARLITGDRNQTYGSPTQNFQDTADVWNVLLRDQLKEGEKITPGQVASLMIALKLVRQIAQPKRDNWVDIAGYAGCGNEVDVETGRIPADPKLVESGFERVYLSEQRSFGAPGDTLRVSVGVDEPAVNVLEQMESTVVPYLHRCSDGDWQWSEEADRINGDWTKTNWDQVTQVWPGDYKVVR